MKKTARHGAVQLGRGQALLLVVGDIVDGIEKRGALAPVARRICRDLGSTVNVSKVNWL